MFSSEMKYDAFNPVCHNTLLQHPHYTSHPATSSHPAAPSQTPSQSHLPTIPPTGSTPHPQPSTTPSWSRPSLTYPPSPPPPAVHQRHPQPSTTPSWFHPNLTSPPSSPSKPAVHLTHNHLRPPPLPVPQSHLPTDAPSCDDPAAVGGLWGHVGGVALVATSATVRVRPQPTEVVSRALVHNHVVDDTLVAGLDQRPVLREGGVRGERSDPEVIVRVRVRVGRGVRGTSKEDDSHK